MNPDQTTAKQKCEKFWTLPNIALEFIKPGKLTQNAYMKRLNALFRYEILSLYVFRALYEIREIPRTVGSTDNEE